MAPLSRKKCSSVVQVCLLLVLASACTRQAEPVRYPVRHQVTRASAVKDEMTIAAVGDIMMPLSIQKAVALNGDRYELLFASRIDWDRWW